MDCYEYFVDRAKFDVLFEIEEYTGHVDTYVMAIDKARSINDPLILFRDSHGPSR